MQTLSRQNRGRPEPESRENGGRLSQPRRETWASSHLTAPFVSPIVCKQMNFLRSFLPNSTWNSCWTFWYHFISIPSLLFSAIASRVTELRCNHSENYTKLAVLVRKLSNLMKMTIRQLARSVSHTYSLFTASKRDSEWGRIKICKGRCVQLLSAGYRATE